MERIIFNCPICHQGIALQPEQRPDSIPVMDHTKKTFSWIAANGAHYTHKCK